MESTQKMPLGHLTLMVRRTWNWAPQDCSNKKDKDSSQQATTPTALHRQPNKTHPQSSMTKAYLLGLELQSEK